MMRTCRIVPSPKAIFRCDAVLTLHVSIALFLRPFSVLGRGVCIIRCDGSLDVFATIKEVSIREVFS